MGKLMNRTKEMLESMKKMEDATMKCVDSDAIMALDEKTLELFQSSVRMLRAYAEKEEEQAQAIEQINDKLDQLLKKKN